MICLFSTDADAVIIRATVSRGYSPVIGAKVTATILGETGHSTQTIELRDGAGPDTTKVHSNLTLGQDYWHHQK